MTHLPPATLLRLNEADVVRLCGLAAAASGLEAAARHEVRQARRTGERLEATVGADSGTHVWVEVTGEPTPSALVWWCSSDTPESSDTLQAGPASECAGASGPACAHVAAVLTAWIRVPGDFATSTSAAADSAPASGDQASPEAETTPNHPPRPRLAQPRLLSAAGHRRGATPLTLADELSRLGAPEVVAMARRVLGSDPDEREARLLLAARLADSTRLAEMVARLEPEARLLLSDMLLLGGAITAADLQARAQRSGRAPSAARTDVAVLERHGLVYRAAGAPGGEAGAERSFGQVAGWRIPLEIRQALAPALPVVPMTPAGPSAAISAPATPPPRRASLGEPAGGAEPRTGAVRVTRGSPRQLALALALLVRAPAPHNPLMPPRERSASPAAAPGASTARERPLFPLIAADQSPSALSEFARLAGMPAGVVRLARRLLLWSRESGTDGALRDIATMPAAERIHALRAGFAVWRSAEEPAELADLNAPGLPVRPRFDTTHTALRPAALATEVAEARAFLARLLGHATPGAWYALDDLLALLWRLHPLFLRGKQLTFATPAWWIERSADGRPLRPTLHEEWTSAEGLYVRELIAGPLYWFGAVDLAAEGTQAAPFAFRLTPFGAYLLGTGPEPEGAGGLIGGDWGPPVLLTRERELAVHPFAAGGNLLATLDAWAEVSTIAGGRLVYTLSPARAAAAFDAGATADGLLRALRADAVGGARVADAVAARLAAWREAYGGARIARGLALVEARDEVALTEALACAPEVAARCRRLAPALAVASPTDGAILRDALKRRGYAV